MGLLETESPMDDGEANELWEPLTEYYVILDGDYVSFYTSVMARSIGEVKDIIAAKQRKYDLICTKEHALSTPPGNMDKFTFIPLQAL